MSLAERRWLRLFTLTLLFFAQGIPWGFLAITLPAYVAERGIKAADIGSLLAMSYWPFAFKFLCGPLIDSFTIPRLGRRRPWILFSQLMMAATAAGLLAIDDPARDFDLLLALVFTHTVFNAMQNVAVDALAIDILPADERGRASGLMYGAKYAGGAVGGAGMGAVIGAWGFRPAVLIQVAILLAIAVVPWLVRESSGPAPAHAPARVVARTLRDVFKQQSPMLCAILMVLAGIAGGLLNAVAPELFMQHLGWPQAEYSEVTGGPGLLVGLIGASTAGFLADKIGHRRLVALAISAMGLAWLVFALGQAHWNDRGFVYALFVAEPLTQSIMVVSLWTLCMDNSEPKTAATQFAAYTSLMNLSTIIGQRFMSRVVTDLDYQAIYLGAAVFQMSLVAIVPFITGQRRPAPA